MVGLKRAVIVGVNEYDDKANISPLSGAINDAEEMYQRLTEFGRFEVPDEHRLIGKDATSDAIRRAISDTMWRTDRRELTLFYFSGHGFKDSYGNGYIAPRDMTYDAPFVRGIQMREIKELALAAVNKDAVVIILDCCYSDIAVGGDDKGGTEGPEPLDHCFATIDAKGMATGRIVMASSGSDRKARERIDCVHRLGNAPAHTHGCFTFQLLEGLDGAGSDPNGLVSLRSLHDFVEQQDLGKQSVKFYGSSVSKSDRIILMEGAQLRTIHDGIAKLEKQFDASNAGGLVRVARDLFTLYKRAPRLDLVISLRKKVEDRLNEYSPQATKFILNQKTEEWASQSKAFSELQRLVPLTVEKLGGVQENAMVGLVMGLLEVIDGLLAEEVFVNQLRQFLSPVPGDGPKTSAKYSGGPSR